MMFDDDPDWDFVMSYAHSEGLGDLVRYAVWSVSELLGIACPVATNVSRANRLIARRTWPLNLFLKGHESVVASLRRQALVGLMIEGQRLAAARALTLRFAPPRALVESQEPTEALYPLAVYRWRRAQRAHLESIGSRSENLP